MRKTSMFRLLRGEMHKILMRPILYVITGVLVLALFFSATLMNMTDRKTLEYSITGSTKEEVLTNFLSNPSMNKSKADENMSSAQNIVLNYSTLNANPETTTSAQLIKQSELCINAFDRYLYYIQNGIINSVKTQKADLLVQTKNLNMLMANAVDGNPKILITNDDFNNFVNLMSMTISILEASGYDENKLEDHDYIASKLKECLGYSNIAGASYFDKLKTICVNNVDDVIISETIIKALNIQIMQSSAHMVTLYDKIVEGVNSADVTVEQTKDYALSYLYTATQIYNYVTDTVFYEPVKTFSDGKVATFKGYQVNDSKAINLYEVEQRITQNAYLLSQNETVNHFSQVFSPTMSFSSQVSALDLVYYGLEICSFVILIFCVILAAGMVAGEQSSGTLKMLAIRPYSRNKILSSKILATILFGMIFIIFSAIVLFLVGAVMYGVDFTTMIAVFNADSVFLISPIAMIFIYIGLLLVKILFYVLLATMISVVFKSNIWAVAISILIYFVSALFSVMFTSSYWYAYLPFAGIDFFKFFGGNLITGNSLGIMLSSPLFYNSDFFVSLLTVLVSIIAMVVISYLTFNKREIR